MAGAGPARGARRSLRVVALAYLIVLLIVPLGLVFWRTFEHGVINLRPTKLSDAKPAAVDQPASA